MQTKSNHRKSSRKYYWANKEKCDKKSLKYYGLYKKKLDKRRREYSARLRTAIFKILGKECVHCGFSDMRALQIDHVRGGGSKEQKKFGGRQLYRVILNKLAEGSDDYQILCANCNWIKRVINNENLR